MYLDFSNQDTVEGKLKATLLENEDRTTCNAENAYVPVTAVVGVAGMGGVGKTTALIALAQDADVREKFSRGGIYFVVVGKDATPGSLVARLKEIVRRSGGKKRCEEIDNNGSLEAAVGTTSSWFAGRKALFLLDDLWQTTFSQTGYFEVLTEILGNSLASHVVISTRSNIIAYETSTRIQFEPRENTGREARGMFLANAGLDEKMIQDDDCEEIVEKILKLCGGVPLMLSIAGAQVRQRTGTPMASLERLSYSLDAKRLILPKEQRGQYPSCFNEAVKASLRTIAEELQTSEKFMESWDEESACNPTRGTKSVVEFVTECFHRLCVLPGSARASEEVIFGMIGVADAAIGWSVINYLVDFHLLSEFQDGRGRPTFGMHDVILDYCEKASRSGQHSKYEMYHREFLSYA